MENKSAKEESKTAEWAPRRVYTEEFIARRAAYAEFERAEKARRALRVDPFSDARLDKEGV